MSKEEQIQELREKIAKLIDAAGLYDAGVLPKGLADQILTLIKEAGYVKPSESIEVDELAQVLYNFREGMTFKSIKATIQSFLLANHYVKLDEDQIFPSGIKAVEKRLTEVQPDGTVWRKVIPIKKMGH